MSSLLRNEVFSYARMSQSPPIEMGRGIAQIIMNRQGKTLISLYF